MNAAQPFRPWAPTPRPKPAGLLQAIWLLQRNVLDIWAEPHFTQPYLYGERGSRAIISVHDPAAIRRVMVDNVAAYGKGPIQQRILRPLLGEGLLTEEGDAWRRTRRTLAPLFTPRRTAALAAAMRRAIERRLDAWRALAPGSTVELEREMTALTFDILSETLFSGDIGGEAQAFEQAMNRGIETLGRTDPLDVIGAPDWLPRLTRLAGMPSIRLFDRRVRAIVTARRARVDSAGDAPDDLLTALLQAQDPETGVGLTDAEVRSNLLTFILAGHETTARALGWTLHLLANAPDALARVEVETEAANDGDPAAWPEALPWTRAVLDESLRLFPPAAGLGREALEADELCGQAIRPGTAVLITPWVIHRHRRLWDDPDAFRPERFLPGARESIDRFAYIPFGAGPRVCIGQRFAMQEALMALVLIVRAFRLHPASPREPRPVHRVTLRADRGLPMRLERR